MWGFSKDAAVGTIDLNNVLLSISAGEFHLYQQEGCFCAQEEQEMDLP